MLPLSKCSLFFYSRCVQRGQQSAPIGSVATQTQMLSSSPTTTATSASPRSDGYQRVPWHGRGTLVSVYPGIHPSGDCD